LITFQSSSKVFRHSAGPLYQYQQTNICFFVACCLAHKLLSRFETLKDEKFRDLK